MSRENNTPFRLVVLISGRGSNMIALHEYVRDCKDPSIEIVAVVSDKPTAAGLEYASEHGIPTATLERKPKELSREEYSRKLAELVASFNPELVVLAGFMRVLDANFVEQFPEKVVNIHPSLLPSFPGLKVHEQALAAGVRFSGATVHFVTGEVDAGPIIAQAVVPVLDNDTPESLAARVLVQEHKIYPASVAAIAAGAVSLDGTRVRVNKDSNALDDSFLLSLGE